ncbi:hypothetical protein F5878DRAFT_663565 [Lentinula raphanica]|uniref:Uncharacterized protein n=1 Tax=Lentinula raphanica TaxID=153919 RepID=A0AA38P3R8_9AGAR|nr:hypothetical protein F5878DRAFT_663565 [Lentinula raphanica]
MVKIISARTVILSLSLLQMGLVTSVLAAPTSTAAGPGLVQPAAVKSGLVSPSITQRFPRHPPHCPLAKVQKRNPGSSDPGSTVDYDPESNKFFEEICKGGDDHSTLLKGNRKSLAPAPVNYPENPNKYILLLAVVSITMKFHASWIAGKPVETRRRPVVKFQDMSKERLQQGGSSSTKKDAKDECRSNGDDSEDACTASDWEISDKDLVLAKDPDETVDVDAALQRRA